MRGLEVRSRCQAKFPVQRSRFKRPSHDAHASTKTTCCPKLQSSGMTCAKVRGRHLSVDFQQCTELHPSAAGCHFTTLCQTHLFGCSLNCVEGPELDSSTNLNRDEVSKGYLVRLKVFIELTSYYEQRSVEQ
eukprot:5897707-Amphidinium_carterae.1